jgi:hypothetical protein
MTAADLACVTCGKTLAEAGLLVRCRLCRQVVMCEDHIGGTIRFHDAPDLNQPVCALCFVNEWRAANRGTGAADDRR